MAGERSREEGPLKPSQENTFLGEILRIVKFFLSLEKREFYLSIIQKGTPRKIPSVKKRCDLFIVKLENLEKSVCLL